jgi:hypothetical protein
MDVGPSSKGIIECWKFIYLLAVGDVEQRKEHYALCRQRLVEPADYSRGTFQTCKAIKNSASTVLSRRIES